MPDPSPADGAAPEDLLLIGRVLKAHGTDGEVKVLPETDDPARFDTLETVYLGRARDQAARCGVESARHQVTSRGPLVLLKLAGTDDRFAAGALRQQQVYTVEEDLAPLDEGESFIHDLIGLTVTTEAGETLGTVRDVVQTPAHDVFVVAPRAQGEPAMIPAVEEFVRAVDLEKGRLVVRPIEGMF